MLTDNYLSKRVVPSVWRVGVKHLSEFWNSVGNDAEHGVERKFSLEEMHIGHIEGNGGIQESLSYVLQIQEVQSRVG